MLVKWWRFRVGVGVWGRRREGVVLAGCGAELKATSGWLAAEMEPSYGWVRWVNSIPFSPSDPLCLLFLSAFLLFSYGLSILAEALHLPARICRLLSSNASRSSPDPWLTVGLLIKTLTTMHPCEVYLMGRTGVIIEINETNHEIKYNNHVPVGRSHYHRWVFQQCRLQKMLCCPGKVVCLLGVGKC